jgi:tRNA (guanine37-N1)-methyltransferase
MEVPQVLLDGNHAKINQWRREQAILTTLKRRPDMLKTAPLTDKERKWLHQKKIEMGISDD